MIHKIQARKPEVGKSEARKPEVRKAEARKAEVRKPGARHPGVMRPSAPSVWDPPSRSLAVHSHFLSVIFTSVYNTIVRARDTRMTAAMSCDHNQS